MREMRLEEKSHCKTVILVGQPAGDGDSTATGMDVAPSALMMYTGSCDDSSSVFVQFSLVRRQSRTCVCLPFSGASLVGREEYMAEESPSFLGSTGLFGRSGKPERRK